MPPWRGRDCPPQEEWGHGWMGKSGEARQAATRLAWHTHPFPFDLLAAQAKDGLFLQVELVFQMWRCTPWGHWILSPRSSQLDAPPLQRMPHSEVSSHPHTTSVNQLYISASGHSTHPTRNILTLPYTELYMVLAHFSSGCLVKAGSSSCGGFYHYLSPETTFT